MCNVGFSEVLLKLSEVANLQLLYNSCLSDYLRKMNVYVIVLIDKNV